MPYNMHLSTCVTVSNVGIRPRVRVSVRFSVKFWNLYNYISDK